MASGISDNVNIFNPERDILDRAVEGYEENVPLVGQIAAGFTIPGMAMDVAAAGKYGRQGVRDFRSGLQNMGSVFGMRKAPSQLASGAGNLGIAALSGLAAIPLFGELAKYPKSHLKGLLKGIDAKKADATINIKKINRTKDASGNVVKSEGKRVDQATKLLEKSGSGTSYKGVTQSQRQPIEVVELSDGTFNQVGGKSTLEALDLSGVTQIPIKIFKNVDDYETYDHIRKNDKAVARQNDARKMLPKKGDPTFEGPVRQFGNKMEQQFKIEFNAPQKLAINSAEEMQNLSKRLNKEFQDEIATVADDLGVDQGFNPAAGKKVGDFDVETGFPAGEVKNKERMIEKVYEKYEGDFSQITDGIRTRIVVETPAQEKLVAERIAKLFPTVDGERVLMNKSGYLDRKLNVQFTGKNGETIIGEIAIITRPMLDGAHKAHPLYEAYRMKNFGLPSGSTIVKIEKEGLRLEKAMKDIFELAGKSIDPRFYDDIIEKFRTGGYVSAGRSGRLSPMTPNMFSNSDFDILEPSMKKSLTWLGVASLHPSSSFRTGSMKPVRLSSLPVMTAAERSQEKYNVSIPQSVQENAQSYNDDIFIELDEADYE